MIYNYRRSSDSDSTPRLSPKIEAITKTIVDFRIKRVPCVGPVRNADRKCKAKPNFAAYGQNLGEYTAMQIASGRVRRKNRTYRRMTVFLHFYLSLLKPKLPSTYSHSTPLECERLNTRFSIDIPPLRGEESIALRMKIKNLIG